MAENFNVGDAFIELRLKQDRLQRDSKQLAGALREQQAQLQGVADKAEEAGKASNEAFGGKLVQTAARAVATMGSIELALGAINVSTKLFSGNIEDAADALKQLPAGIGPVARQLEALLGTVTGIADDIERAEMVTRAMNVAIDAQQDAAQAVADIERDRVETLRELNHQLELLRADPTERPFLAARQKVEADLAAARAELEAAQTMPDVSDANRKSLDEINEQIRELEEKRDSRTREFFEDLIPVGVLARTTGLIEDPDQRRDNIENDLGRLRAAERQIREADKAEKQARIAAAEEALAVLQEIAKEQNEEINENERRAAEERLRIAQHEAEQKRRLAEREAAERRRQAEREREEALRQLERTINLRSDLVQKLLREQGRDLEAEIEGIVNQAENQLNNAGSPEEADLIRQNRDADIRASIRNAEESLRSASPQAGISSLQSAIDNLQSAALGGDDPAIAQRREQIELAKRQAALAQQQADSLKTVERNTAGQGRAVVGR